jgi:hypothetical protein
MGLPIFGHMWKKAVAILCLPICALLTYSTIRATVTAFLGMKPEGTMGYRIGYMIGLGVCIVAFGLLTFFLLQWSVRVLSRSRIGFPEEKGKETA